MKRLLFALVLAGCSSKSPQASSPPPSSPPPPSNTEPAGAGDGSGSAAAQGPGIGEKCGAGDACAQGLTCISYYGIAGARGPQFKTCEIKCDKDHEETVCPKGTHCATIADGPGSVCR
ncbi:MAG TPA: hypothetical protein VLB44_21640 [Kofleriaceae bacterium]|nr:hypothetical protein [Kofleriaceae bacterium]